MNMFEVLLGAAIGAAGVYLLKSQSGKTKSQSQISNLTREVDILTEENNKLSKRFKEAERQIEDLLHENEKLHKESKSIDDDKDDLADELDTAKNKIKRLAYLNEELTQKMNEYKSARDAYEVELKQLRNK